MTKPIRSAQRAEEWTFDMPAGLARHGPTGLEFRLQPDRASSQAGGAGRPVGQVRLPPGVKDRREAARIDPGDANAPAVDSWTVLADARALEAAAEQLAQLHGTHQAPAVLARICREAGERWIYRARLERGWTDGRRAK